MKKFLFVLAMLALVATPVLAVTECPEGQHYEVTGTECSEWSTPECTHYSWVWNWSRFRLEKVCDAWSERVCLSTVETGACVDNQVEPEPEPVQQELVCEDGYDKKDGQCVQHVTGGSWVTTLPRVVDNIVVNKGCVSFLTTHKSIGGILMGKKSSEFPLDTFRKPYIDPIGWPVCSTAMLGYELRYEEETPAVYHTICPKEKGEWYVRPYMTNYFNGQPDYGKLYGNEVKVDL